LIAHLLHPECLPAVPASGEALLVSEAAARL
jgi:hypothetical protein